MTWLADFARCGWLAMLLALTTVVQAAPDVTNALVPVLSAAAETPAIPAWMELSALATNATEWADLADTWRRKPDANASPSENLTLPVEHYDNGRIKAVLHAGKAFLGNDLIWSWQVAVDFFDPAGLPDGRIEAESCLYDRNARRVYCPASVMLIRTNATISGVGMYWTQATQRMWVLSNAVVRLQQKAKFSGAKSGKNDAERGLLPDHKTSAEGTPKQ